MRLTDSKRKVQLTMNNYKLCCSKLRVKLVDITVVVQQLIIIVVYNLTSTKID